MNLLQWLKDRRQALAIATLAVFACTGQFALWWMRGQQKVSDFVGPPRSGYTLTHFKGVVYDVDGLPKFRLAGPHLERRESDESLYLNEPQFDLVSKDPGAPDWHGASLYGWVDKTGTLLKLQGQAVMHRPPYGNTPATDLFTADVTAWPRENRMETAAPARMVQGATTLKGVGMRANLTDNHLELLDDSHGTYPARKRKS